MEVLSESRLREINPLKWHSRIPEGGFAFGIADIDFQGPKGLADFLRSNLTDDFTYYQPKQGSPKARELVKQFMEDLGHSNVNLTDIQILPGTMLGIYSVMEWASRREGEVLILDPIYPPYHYHATFRGNKIYWSPFKENGSIDEEQLKNNCNKNTKLFAINNPNNPTGHILTESEIRLIRDLATEFDFYIVVDELYQQLVVSQGFQSLGSVDGLEDKVFTINGFSKANGLAGFRSGFIVTPSKESVEIQEIVSQTIVTPSPTSSLVAEFALTDQHLKAWTKDFANTTLKTSRFVAEKFNKEGYNCPNPSVGFFAFPDLGILEDEMFAGKLLETKGVEVVPGSQFGMHGSGKIRINCATSIQRLDDGTNRIFEMLNDFKKNLR